MSKPFPFSGRRIDRLRSLAYECGLTEDEACEYGKLTVTRTWETLLFVHGIEFEKKSDSGRRIDCLRSLAYGYGLTNGDARQHGKLNVTKTWERLLSVHGIL
jgi:hypothetical protein